MMKIGCCIPGGSFMPQGENEIPLSPLTRLTEGSRVVRACGYDCAEASVGMITALSEEELAFLRAEYEAGRFAICSCNSFIPGQFPIVTDEAGTKALYDYAEHAIARMASLGIPYVVFGSGRVRTIPEDIDRAQGEAQIEAFIAHCDKMCGKYGMTLVIEPLNTKETNWCITVAEGAALVRRLQLQNVKLLADGYHMSQANEPMSVITDNADIIRHCHIASTDRKIPGSTAYENDMIDALKAIDYDGVVSVECGFTDFMTEAAEAARYLRDRIG